MKSDMLPLQPKNLPIAKRGRLSAAHRKALQKGPDLQHGGGLIVSSGTVLDGQNEHHAGLFPNVANNPVIANPITPQPAKLMTQGLPEAARVFVRGNPGVHLVENFPLH
jgi:hypothetical protein